MSTNCFGKFAFSVNSTRLHENDRCCVFNFFPSGERFLESLRFHRKRSIVFMCTWDKNATKCLRFQMETFRVADQSVTKKELILSLCHLANNDYEQRQIMPVSCTAANRTWTWRPEEKGECIVLNFIILNKVYKQRVELIAPLVHRQANMQGTVRFTLHFESWRKLS